MPSAVMHLLLLLGEQDGIPLPAEQVELIQDAIGKNLSEAYVGQLPAKDVLKKTENEWNAIIGRIGRSKLKNDLASYKAVMPKKALPT